MVWLCLNRTYIIRIPNFHSFWQQNNDDQTMQKQIVSNIKCYSCEQLPFCLISSRSLLHSKAIRVFLIGNWKLLLDSWKISWYKHRCPPPVAAETRQGSVALACCARSRNCNLWFTPESPRHAKKRPQAEGAGRVLSAAAQWNKLFWYRGKDISGTQNILIAAFLTLEQ